MCDRPLKGFVPKERDQKTGLYVPKKTKNGKPFYMICSPEVNYIWMDNNDRWHKSYDFNSSNFVTCKDVVKEYKPIPCGSCLSCRINRAGELADRCMLEMNYHDKACFVTLTYNDDHIIRSHYTRTDTGECGVSETLFKKHYMDFFKRLRKHNSGCNIRYVLCGEYGSLGRPHYHAIIFGYRPDDLVPYTLNRRGQWLYTSRELESIWKNGFVIIGDVTKDSANYVTRYVTKKLYSDVGEENYQKIGRIPPFITTSKRPAIGRLWYEDNKDWCMDHQISYSTDRGGRNFKAPRYFRKLAEAEGIVSWTQSEYMDNSNDAAVTRMDYEKTINKAGYDKISQAKEREREAINKAFTRDLK